MNRIIISALFFTIFGFSLIHAADKVRISMTRFAGQFMTFPLAQKRGFLAAALAPVSRPEIENELSAKSIQLGGRTYAAC